MIRFAITDYFGDDPKSRGEALARYRKRLERLSRPEARRLLQEIFPDAGESSADVPADHKRADLAHDMHRELVASLEELFTGTKDRLNEEDREDFQKQIRLIQENPAETDRLQRRWNKAKACLPSEIQDFGPLVARIEQLVAGIAVKRPTVSLALSEEDVPALSTESTATQETSRSYLQDVETKDSRGLISSKSTDKRPIQRRNVRPASQPGRHLKLDLHDMSIPDALLQVSAYLQKAAADSSIRCLVIVHGYGKMQSSAPMRGEIRAFLRREQKRVRRVQTILLGERLDGFDADSMLVKEACPEISFEDLGVRNPGLTLVLFD